MVLTFKPISILRKQDEFKWGANAWIDSMHTFAQNFNYSNHYYAAVFLQIMLFILFISACYVLIKYKNEVHSNYLHLFFTTGLILLIVLLSITQRFFFNTMYMDGRKATMYTILVILLSIQLLASMAARFKNMSMIIGGLLVCMPIYQAFSLHRISAVREWWFDEHNYDVARYIYTHPIQGKRGMSADWHFSSALQYYNRFEFQHALDPLAAPEAITSTNDIAYYFVFREALPLIPPDYSPLTRIQSEWLLFAKDSASYHKQAVVYFQKHDSTKLSHPWDSLNATIIKNRSDLDALHFNVNPIEFKH